jgi:hypothetical protein
VSAGVRRPQTVCLLLLAAGIALGAVTGDAREPQPLVSGGYTVLSGDFHIHSSPDGMPPWDAAREAHRRRLDVIALTGHNSMIGWWLWRHAPWREPGVMVLPGEELTSVGYHMAIVGLSSTIPWHQSAASAAAAAHEQGAVAILAHPATVLPGLISDADLRAVDGIEVVPVPERGPDAGRKLFSEFYRRASVLRPVAIIGSSDYHYTAPIGLCRTYLFVRQVTPDGVLEAIRSARTVSCDWRGHADGPPDLATIVADRCRVDAVSPPVGDSSFARAGALLSWGALAALVVLGAG